MCILTKDLTKYLFSPQYYSKKLLKIHIKAVTLYCNSNYINGISCKCVYNCLACYEFIKVSLLQKRLTVDKL